ncbi:hypothetical protein QWZ08_21180 [Ferruginibacter paludis]|uniref:hypothetical protein n=1 Tax=Ferruginibacter paludis TaxID=1310417 RepID=UPI0025B3CFAD|nr:hypothetical protein [Ferruginibacter paludis]MDN3658179.1 hypothetical protein [Ferruginibacter paludis]
MKNFKLISTTIVLCAFIITSCTKEIGTSNNPNLQSESTLSKQPALISADLQLKLTKLRASMPAGYEKRVQKNTALLLKMHPEYRAMVQRALSASSPASCNDNTPLNQLLASQLADWNSDIIYFALATGMLDFPTYDALLFENTAATQYFGVKGEYTQIMAKTFKDLKRFWNIQSNNIVLVGMHGSMLLNRDKLIRIDMILYGDSQVTAAYTADLIILLLKDVPQYQNGNHPIFTFNSFAQNAFTFSPYGIIPAKIVMGDGIMQDFTATGYGDVAPQAILAHEFGHQIQFQLGVFGTVSSPEATRRTELMADAYSAYYLSHARGASMQWKRVLLFLQVFFNIGDCQVTNDGHHGTPTQRMASAQWGYSVANDAQKQGRILTSQEFTALFEKQLPVILLK